jgi:hypothetical protein
VNLAVLAAAQTASWQTVHRSPESQRSDHARAP